MTRLWKPRSGAIGLDIGHDSVKMIQLEPLGQILSVTAAARWQFPAKAAEDPAARRQLTVEAVRDLVRTHGFKGRRVVCSLDADALTIKQVRLPRMSEQELRPALLWEANERFGFNVQPDQMDYVRAGEIRQGADVRDEIILLGAKSEAVNALVEMCDEMKLTPAAIDAEPAALFRSFERFQRRRGDENNVTVLVEIGARATRVVIARGRELAFIKAIPIGGRDLNRAVAEELNLSYEEAGQLRLQAMRADPAESSSTGRQLDQVIFDATRSTVEQLCKEITLCLRYFAVTFRGAKPEQVTLLGGEAHDPTLRSLLNEQLHIDCQPGQPMQKVDLSAVDLGADRRDSSMCEWAVAMGLALYDMPDQFHAMEHDDEANRLSA